MAQHHGKIAALNMMGIESHLVSVPFFWSMVCGKSLRFAGSIVDSEDVIIEGDWDKFSVVAYYFLGDAVTGVATFNRDPVASLFAELIRTGKGLQKSQIKSWLADNLQT
jgi:hypothetical protein